MATTIEMIEEMQSNAEKARAAAQSGAKNFVGNSIVILADGQQALVRPVYNMPEAIVIPIHDKYKNTDASLASRKDQSGGYQAAPITNMCATHQGKPCLFCAQPKEAKLEARPECFVPVYLFGIKDSAGNVVTYTDPDGNEKPVKGFRMLRLKASSPILAQLMTVYKDQDYDKDITGCDFLMDRHGSGLDTKYGCTPKPPRPMNANLKAAIPPREKFEQILLEIYEPRILERPAVANADITLTPVQQASTITRAEAQKIVTTAPEEEFTF